MRNKSED